MIVQTKGNVLQVISWNLSNIWTCYEVAKMQHPDSNYIFKANKETLVGVKYAQSQ